jgi:hypothetical protein
MVYPQAFRTIPRRIGFIMAVAAVTARIVRMEMMEVAGNPEPPNLFDTTLFLHLMSYSLGMIIYFMILADSGTLVLVIGTLVFMGGDILAIADTYMGRERL